MGILSSLNTWIDEGAKEQERIRIARREEKKKKIDEFVHKEYTGKVFGTKPLMDLFGTHNLDEAFKGNAPLLTMMLEEIYLNQKQVSRMQELEGRYAELKERYDELKKEYDRQNELIAEIAKKSALTR